MGKMLFSLLAVFFLSLQLSAQKTVTGKVTDDVGNPLSNVSVTVKGTSTGTTTRDDGTFTLAVNSSARTLTFSQVDMTTVDQTIPTSNFVEVILTSLDRSMDEVILVGYGTVKKGDFTGSANQVGYEDFKNRPILNPLNALVATGPGVQTTAAGGSPGSSPGIRIRGFGSIGASDGP